MSPQRRKVPLQGKEWFDAAQILAGSPVHSYIHIPGLGSSLLAFSLAEKPGLAVSRRAVHDCLGNPDRWQDREYDEERRRQALASAGRRCRGRGDLAIVPG